MKQTWQIFLLGPDPDTPEHKRKCLHRSTIRGSLQKALGTAMLDIHHYMLGEFYCVRQAIDESRVTLVADGTRGGYPQQPDRILVEITPKKEVGDDD